MAVMIALLLEGCTIHEEGRPSGASEQTRGLQSVPGETDPCGLLDQSQRDRLGIRDGNPAEDVQLEGASFCGWRTREFNGGTFQGAALPNK